MTAADAIIYCLGFRSDTPEDGEYHSRAVLDRVGSPHWVAWKDGVPRFCTSGPFPAFSESLAPYRPTK